MKIDFYGLFSVDIVYALTAIAAVALLALVVAIIAVFKASSMKKRYNTFMQGEDGKTVERLVKDNLDSIRELKTISEENKTHKIPKTTKTAIFFSFSFILKSHPLNYYSKINS